VLQPLVGRTSCPSRQLPMHASHSGRICQAEPDLRADNGLEVRSTKLPEDGHPVRQMRRRTGKSVAHFPSRCQTEPHGYLRRGVQNALNDSQISKETSAPTWQRSQAGRTNAVTDSIGQVGIKLVRLTIGDVRGQSRGKFRCIGVVPQIDCCGSPSTPEGLPRGIARLGL
jgi:hypothetical protein